MTSPSKSADLIEEHAPALPGSTHRGVQPVRWSDPRWYEVVVRPYLNEDNWVVDRTSSDAVRADGSSIRRPVVWTGSKVTRNRHIGHQNGGRASF